MSPLTTFLSRLIGLFLILVALPLVTHRRETVETLTALVRNPPLLFILGMVFWPPVSRSFSRTMSGQAAFCRSS